MDDKSVLRHQLLGQRGSLSAALVSRKSQRILDQLLGILPWHSISSLHCFTTIPSLREIDVSGLYNFVWREFPCIATYSVRKIDGTWQHGQLKPNGVFVSLAVEVPAFDVIIVPMLGFDDQRHRLGHGGGFYDKFLATQPESHKIGVCYEFGQVNSLPTEPHDIPMDIIVTEKSCIR